MSPAELYSHYDKPSPQEYLSHHGVLGQKWGERNGPPYPLKASDHSASKKKAHWRRSLDGSGGEDRPAERTAASDHVDDKAGQKPRFQLSPRGKTALKIGAAVAATALIAYGTYKLADSGKLNQLAAKGKAFIHGEEVSFKKNEAFARAMSAEEIAQTFFGKINPGYGDAIGTSNNCRRCTFAYEIARRGYDVRATRTITGAGQSLNGVSEAINKGSLYTRFKYARLNDMDYAADDMVFAERARLFREAVMDHTTIFSDKKGTPKEQKFSAVFTRRSSMIFKHLASYPDGARGELSIDYNGGKAGHSLVWEIIKGRPVIFDMQTSKMYRGVRDLDDMPGWARCTEAAVLRLDNVDLDLDFLHRWVKNDG